MIQLRAPYTFDDELLLSVLGEVPGKPSSLWNGWEQQVKRSPSLQPDLLLWVLSHGQERLHYGAVLALRMLGYEVWGRGYGSNFAFEVRSPGSSTVETIIPDFSPEEPPPGNMICAKKPG